MRTEQGLNIISTNVRIIRKINLIAHRGDISTNTLLYNHNRIEEIWRKDEYVFEIVYRVYLNNVKKLGK